MGRCLYIKYIMGLFADDHHGSILASRSCDANSSSPVLARQHQGSMHGAWGTQGKTLPPGPFNEVRQVVEKTERVEGIASDLSHSPGDQKKHHALLVLDLRVRESHSAVGPWAFVQ